MNLDRSACAMSTSIPSAAFSNLAKHLSRTEGASRRTRTQIMDGYRSHRRYNASTADNLSHAFANGLPQHQQTRTRRNPPTHPPRLTPPFKSAVNVRLTVNVSMCCTVHSCTSIHCAVNSHIRCMYCQHIDLPVVSSTHRSVVPPTCMSVVPSTHPSVVPATYLYVARYPL